MIDQHIPAVRNEFEEDSGGSTALPIAGAVVWTVVGIVALFLNTWFGTLAMLVGTGLIILIAILLSKLLGENIFSKNPLGKLMALATLNDTAVPKVEPRPSSAR